MTIYSDQNIHISHGMSSIRLMFGEHALEMIRQQAMEIGQQMVDRMTAERCCGTCLLWSGKRPGVMGRCTAATPPWVTREADMMHKDDGANCDTYHIARGPI